MTRRGTTNSNERGSTTDRRRRREWLIARLRAWADRIDRIDRLRSLPGTANGYGKDIVYTEDDQ